MNNKLILGMTLLDLKGFGKVKVRNIMESIPFLPNSSNDVIDLLDEYILQTNKKLPEYDHSSIHLAMDRAQRVLDNCLEAGINIDFIDSNDERQWVRRYATIPSPPIMLFSLGDTSAMDMPTVAIIGTRKPTSIGSVMAERVTEKFVEHNFCIVSGLAMGCDIKAHQSALSNQGLTSAILAHGLNEVHPVQHTEIALEIIEKGGCLISEYPPGTPIERGYYIERDRLQSGGSLGVVVIETSIDGGSFHTARFAEKQKRFLASLDHPNKYHHLESVKGNRKLISNGAIAIWDESSLIQFLEKLKSESNLVVDASPKQETFFD